MSYNAEYLFICGCGRSGTSALAQYVGQHNDIVMGMERFGHLVLPGKFSLTPEHFSKERFLEMRSEDTFYSDFEQFHKWDPSLHQKLGTSRYIGDKRPELFNVYEELFTAFPGAKLLFIYRDPLNVADSWKRRCVEGKNWPAQNDAKKSVHVWNNSLKKTIEALKNGANILALNYEDFFYSDKDICPLFDFLDLEFQERDKERLRKYRVIGERLSTKRESILTSDEITYVNEHAEKRFLQEFSGVDMFARG